MPKRKPDIAKCKCSHARSRHLTRKGFNQYYLECLSPTCNCSRYDPDMEETA